MNEILIAGTGAMACAIGARLARAGVDVTLAGTWHEALAAIAARGVCVHGAPGEATWSVPVAAAPLDALTTAFSLALVLVKSHQTTAVAAALARVLEPSGIAITLQNGLGNREALAAALGSERVVAGVAIMGSALVSPGEVTSAPGRIVLASEPADRMTPLASLLRSAGIEAETATPIEPVLWRKLVANGAINALTALHGVTNGALLADQRLRTEMAAAARATGAVAAAKGIRLDADPVAIAFEVARLTASNRSSMRQDLERGARTEIDAMNGAVVREGRRHGVPTPVNERLWRRVREREGRPLQEENER